ncbi:MAG: hypothetical protein ABIR94_13385 [Rubrivivax sp.]
MTTRTFYRGYVLSSNPMALGDGRFQARVAITALGGDKTCAQRFLDLDAFATHDEALQQAIRSGMEWIDINDRPH